jgi:16S rRNA (uracil1498-N3)-methyltransferase
MADRFYVNCPLAPGPVTIKGPEAHHLATVCRLRPGDAVCLFNGDGHEYPAEVIDVARRTVTVRVQNAASPQREVSFRLELAVPLPKGDRAQFLLEKLTELGVTVFTPLQTARSVVHPREAKLDRLQRHVIEASKQCGRNVLLRVEPLTDWSSFCQRNDLPLRRILAHPSETIEGHQPAIRPGQDIVFAVGPEGGFTEDEVRQAKAAGWGVVDLGPRILRVETAAIALACLAAIQPA